MLAGAVSTSWVFFICAIAFVDPNTGAQTRSDTADVKESPYRLNQSDGLVSFVLQSIFGGDGALVHWHQ
jgi:hypothetical protein